MSQPISFLGSGSVYLARNRSGDNTLTAKVREALEKSGSPERQQQAAAWKVYRAHEGGANGSVFAFTMDPAVKGADQAVSAILAEARPTEAKALYRTFAEAYASGQNYVNLTLSLALGAP